MLENTKIVYVFLYVADMKRSRDFFESTLGLRVLEEDDDAVKYDCGGLILALNRAQQFGVPVSAGPDDTSILVFHTDQIHELRSALEKRGLQFSGPTFDSHVGAIANFYDPDGHSFSLYQANDWARTRESWKRITTILNADFSAAGLPSPPANQPLEQVGLGASRIVYMFLFIRNFDEGREYFEKKLGLEAVEVTTFAGVCKYDMGSFLLSTHEIHAEQGAKATLEGLTRPRTSSPVFWVGNFDDTYKALKEAGAKPTAASTVRIGKLCQIADPSGHTFYVYEPSLEALAWPSGAKIRRVLSVSQALTAPGSPG